jgi:hypothetical protein
MITNVPSPCSVCGRRTKTESCARCAERAIAMAGSVESRLRFEQEELERLARCEVNRLDLGPSPPVPLEVAIVGSGMPRNVALVSCGKAKLRTSEKVSAHQLYVGTPFKLSFQYAMATSDDVQILSALHGVLGPYELVAPYEFSMAQMFISEQALWGKRVVNALKGLYPVMHLRLIFYASRQYIRPILGAVSDEDRRYWSFEDPLQGLDMFERNTWLKRKLEALDDHPPF